MAFRDPITSVNVYGGSTFGLGVQVLNVLAFGAVGDGLTDCTNAINAALAGCPEGGVVYFPPGRYGISAAIQLRRNQTLEGTHAGRWPYDTGTPCSLVALPNFAGKAMLYIPDEEELTGTVSAPADSSMMAGPGDQCGIRVIRLALDGANVGTTVDGIQASGLVRDLRLMEVAVRRTTGVGIHSVGYNRKNGSNVVARGWALQQVVTDRTQGHGYS